MERLQPGADNPDLFTLRVNKNDNFNTKITRFQRGVRILVRISFNFVEIILHHPIRIQDTLLGASFDSDWLAQILLTKMK